MNVAVTFWALVNVRVQLLRLLQAPLQPAKVWPLAGVAVRVTVVPLAKSAVHVPLVQLRPLGLLVTVPLPLVVTVRGTEVGMDEDVAGVMRT